MDQCQLPGPIWGEYHDDEGALRRIDTLFADADVLGREGRGYDAEILAGAAAILAERACLAIDPATPVAALVEPGQRARAAQRPLPAHDGSPAGQLDLLTALAAYSEQDGRHAEAAGIREDANDLAVELEPDSVEALEASSEDHNDLARAYEAAAREHRRLGYEAEVAADDLLREGQRQYEQARG